MRARASPSSRPRSRDIDEADVILRARHRPLHSSPILDLRIRKAIRRNGARLAVATERPTALDGGAEAIARYAPGEARPSSSPSSPPRRSGSRERRHAAGRGPARALGKVVVVWGERIAREGEGAPAPCSTSPPRWASPRTRARDCSKSPRSANARGLREAGCPARRRSRTDLAPAERFSGSAAPRRSARRSSRGEIEALILFGVDPTPRLPRHRRLEDAPSPRPITSSPSRPSRPRPPRWPTSSSRSRPTPRKTAPSPTPTAACSGCAPPPPAPATSAPNWGVLAELSLALGHDTGLQLPAHRPSPL